MNAPLSDRMRLSSAEKWTSVSPCFKAEMFGLDNTTVSVKRRDLDSVDATSMLTLKITHKDTKQLDLQVGLVCHSLNSHLHRVEDVNFWPVAHCTMTNCVKPLRHLSDLVLLSLT